MKSPSTITFQDFSIQFPLTKQFENVSIIDVRSPSEFALDHIPGAINCPVLNDEERIAVGTLYKQVGSFEAKKVGASIVAKNIAFHLENKFQQKDKHWQALIYCWRGGNRSGSMIHIFSKIGWQVMQLDGGYKQFRHHVNDALPIFCQQIQWNVICGATGSGKSRLLESLEKYGAQVLDLEKIAQHRGSVLGSFPNKEQPSQKMFESRIWHVLSQMDFNKPIFIEAESKKIGNLRLPESIYDSMHVGEYIHVDLGLPHRVELLMQEYAHFALNTPLLTKQLNCLAHLHGKNQIADWCVLATNGQLSSLVSELLSKHYDPAYLRSHQRNFAGKKNIIEIKIDGVNMNDFEFAAKRLLAI
jgi:tRNA 2-selenouridine synthase